MTIYICMSLGNVSRIHNGKMMGHWCIGKKGSSHERNSKLFVALGQQVWKEQSQQYTQNWMYSAIHPSTDCLVIKPSTEECHVTWPVICQPSRSCGMYFLLHWNVMQDIVIRWRVLYCTYSDVIHRCILLRQYWGIQASNHFSITEFLFPSGCQHAAAMTTKIHNTNLSLSWNPLRNKLHQTVTHHIILPWKTKCTQLTGAPSRQDQEDESSR